MKRLILILFILMPFVLRAQSFAKYVGDAPNKSMYDNVIPDPDPEPDDGLIHLAIVGNSIAATTYDSLIYEYPGEFNLYNIAHSGDVIADQLVAWNAIPEDTIATFDYVCIAPLGVNDIASGESFITVSASYNSLITAIHNDIPSTCKIVMSVMTPAKGAIYVSDAEVEVLKNVNTNYIMNSPANVDIAYSTNYTDLTDGADGLYSWYDSGDHLHPGWLGKSIMRENLLEAIEYDPADNWLDILYEEDFNDFTVTALHSATSPVGIPNDSLAAHISKFESLGSDSYNDPDIADNADIVSFGGSNALKSWYLIDQCCTGNDVGLDNVTDGGTGIDIYIWINSDHSDEEETWVIWKEWIDADFENSDGFKEPGLIDSKSNPHITSRLLMSNYGGYEFNLAHYTYAYYDGDGTTRAVTNRHNVNTGLGRWVYKATRTFVGTTGNWDGFVELFVDGIKVGNTMPSKPFLVSGSGGFVYFNISTFMGGGSDDYKSPRTQWIIHDDFKVGKPNGYAPFSGSTQAPSGADIRPLLRLITDFPD